MELNHTAAGPTHSAMPLASMQQHERAAAEPLKLFIVTLHWAVDDHEEGDYCNSVWARNHDEAVRLIAEEMSQLSDSGCNNDKEREEFVAESVANASQYAATCVAEQVGIHLQELMSGPQRSMSTEADHDLATIMQILSKYGVVGKD